MRDGWLGRSLSLLVKQLYRVHSAHLADVSPTRASRVADNLWGR
jgi:hypothetical protein